METHCRKRREDIRRRSGFSDLRPGCFKVIPASFSKFPYLIYSIALGVGQISQASKDSKAISVTQQSGTIIMTIPTRQLLSSATDLLECKLFPH